MLSFMAERSCGLHLYFAHSLVFGPERDSLANSDPEATDPTKNGGLQLCS